MEMDREFLQDLRDLKPVLEKETYDELKGYVLSIMKSKLPDRIYSDLDSNFKSFTRAVVNIAYGLNHSKEARDLFVDIVEKSLYRVIGKSLKLENICEQIDLQLCRLGYGTTK
ncbi:UNVERIFIED_CONTAM: Fibp [Trichonephila clavipes]